MNPTCPFDLPPPPLPAPHRPIPLEVLRGLEVDGSLRICVKLASASKVLRAKLQHVSASCGLRLVVEDGKTAVKIKRQLRGSFHVGELVLRSD